MEKRERLSAALAGEPIDRVPVCLWRHWPGDDQRSADLARVHLQWQYTFDWDVMVIAPAPNYLVTGYGLTDVYEGSLEGQRTVQKHLIKRSLDWTEIRPLDPNRGDLFRQIETIRLIAEASSTDPAPLVQVVYSPLTQALRLAGRDTLLRHLRTHPDRLLSGLTTLADTTLRLVDALRRSGLAGVYYVMDAAYELLSEAEYRTAALPFDRQILSALPTRWWLNIGHLGGDSPMLGTVSELPLQGWNWASHTGGQDMERGRSQLRGAMLGGLARRAQLHDGTPVTVGDSIRQTLHQSGGRRLILGCDGPLLLTTPQSNILAVRDSVQAPVR